MFMPKRPDSENKTSREVLDKQAKIIEEKYTQIKLAIHSVDAEPFKDYCQANELKMAAVIREMIKDELKAAAKAEDGLGKFGKRLKAQKEQKAKKNKKTE